MKRISLVLCCMLAVFCGHGYADTIQPLDQVVAVVNDDVISKTELDQALQIVNQQIAEAHVEAPGADVLKKQVLDQLIIKKLQLQLAKQAGITIKDQEVNDAIKRIADQNHISADMLYDHLHQDGITTAEYRNEIRDQITIQKLQQQEIASKISVTPKEITDALNAHRGSTAEADAAHSPSRQWVESYLLQQKFEEAAQQWISKLRGQAFIQT